jgi:hypothetical protein
VYHVFVDSKQASGFIALDGHLAKKQSTADLPGQSQRQHRSDAVTMISSYQ